MVESKTFDAPLPKVSVILPNFNHAQYLQQRIESILAQSYSDYEVIILDDCSTDYSRDIIEDYRGRSKVSHIVYNSINSGSPFAQWKRGVGLAKGQYIWIAESDDYASPDFLKNLLPFFEIDSSICLVCTAPTQVDLKGSVIYDLDKWFLGVSSDHWNDDYINSGEDEIRNYLSIRNTIPNASGVLIRKDAFLKHIGFISGFKYLGDWYLWLRILHEPNVKLAFVNQSLNFFRKHANTTRAKKLVSSKVIEEWYQCLLFANKKIVKGSFSKTAICDMEGYWRENSLVSFFEAFSIKNLSLGLRINRKLPLVMILGLIRYYRKRLQAAAKKIMTLQYK